MRDLVKRRANWRKWYQAHKADQNKKIYFSRSRRKKVAKDWLVAYKNTVACESCGIDNPIVLDFHHKDPKQKRFQLADAIRHTQSISTIKKEIDKCKVLCANCHRIEHAKLTCRNVA